MHSLLSECDVDLKKLYSRIECTLLRLGGKKYAELIYNLGSNVEENVLKNLIRWKRIVGIRMYDCNYPCSSIKTKDILSLTSYLNLVEKDCSECETCFPTLNA